MANGRGGVVFQQMSRLLRFGTVGGLGEVQLLERFIERRDEVAFEALLARHGPMVLGVCRQVLHDPHQVEDAFQATFLVLVHRAGSIRRRERLASWLYGVAHRVAVRARHAHRDRRLLDSELVLEPTACEIEQQEEHAALHEEVNRLPDKYRAPIVLCYLEGLTHDEAAARLGWPVGTVRGRMARGRDVLRRRLTARGVAFSMSAFAAGAVVPEALAAATLRAAVCDVGTTRIAAGVVSAQVLALLEGVLHAMFVQKLKLAAVFVLAGALLVSGAGVLAFQAAGDGANAQTGPTRVQGGEPASGATNEVMAERLAQQQTASMPDDATLLRRAYLDAFGRPPTPDETRRFVDEEASARRARLSAWLSRRPASTDVLTALVQAVENADPGRVMLARRPPGEPTDLAFPIDQRVKSEVRELELEADREHLRRLLRMQREMKVEELTKLRDPMKLNQLARIQSLPDEMRKQQVMMLEQQEREELAHKRNAEEALRERIEQLKRSYTDQKIEFEESRLRWQDRGAKGPEGQDEGGLTSQSYDVGDLLLPPSADGSRGSDKADMNAIIALIKNSTARGTWADDGKPAGTPGSITPFFPRASIIVQQTPAGHEEVRVLLQGLRRLRDAQIANAGKAAPKAEPLKKD